MSDADRRQPPVSADLPRPMIPFSHDEVAGLCAMQARQLLAWVGPDLRVHLRLRSVCAAMQARALLLIRAADLVFCPRFTCCCVPLPAGRVQAHCQTGKRV